MKELLILIAPVFWSLKNDIIRFHSSFYKKASLFIISSLILIFLLTTLLNIGMLKLQNISPDVFNVLLMKGYSLIFIIIFLIQIINGFIISLDTFYQSKELEILLTSPVNRTSLFFSRLLETHLKSSWMLIIFGIPLLISSGLLFHPNILYYFYSLLLFIFFSIVPVNIGVCIAILISGVFQIRKLKNFMFSAGVISAVAIAALLRFFSPERFVNPELFANLTLFLSEIKAPFFILLPNRWISESIFNFLGKSLNIYTIIFISLLILTAYITTILSQIIFQRYHYRGWGLFQKGGIILEGKRHYSTMKFFYRLLSIFNRKSIVLTGKDLLYQIRDVTNIHQIFILFSLIVIYLFSISALPLNWEYFSRQLRYIVSFFNLGLILIIITSICSRIIYPAIVSEGSFLWLIKTSPIRTKRYIRSKFFFFFIPVFLIGQILTIVSSYLIGIEKEVFFLKIFTTFILSLSLVSLAVFFGISDLRHKINEVSDEQTRSGSTIYMIVSVFLIFFTLTIEIIPLFLYFLKGTTKMALTVIGWYLIGGVISILLLANLIIIYMSIYLSNKRFDELQIN
jgi:ABC-2 type transport system permease protein